MMECEESPLRIAGQVRRGGARRLIDTFIPTVGQLQFLSWGVKNGVWRGGNQIGKTRAHAAHIAHLSRGTHPWRLDLPRPPVESLLISYSWQQMDKLLRELMSFLPAVEVDPKVRYVKGGGVKGYKEVRIPIVAGSGAGSIIHLRTYRQGSESFAGMEVHYVGLDEPPPPGIIGEALGRTSTHDGETRVTMTPTPSAPPQDELKKLVEEGIFGDMQTSLSLEACTPMGGLPWRSADAIQRKIRSWLPLERPMRQHGAWDPVMEGRQLDAFSEAHIRYAPSDRDLRIAVATDHGMRAGRQGAVLIAWDGHIVYVLDEYRPTGTTSSRDDGRAIVEMLARWGQTVYDVTYWIGDRAAESKAAKKDNARLAEAVAAAAGVDRREAGIWFSTPHKTKLSVMDGLSECNSLFHEMRLFISPRCVELKRSILRWEGKPKDPFKDLIDAMRYGVEVLLAAQEVAKPRIVWAA